MCKITAGHRDSCAERIEIFAKAEKATMASQHAEEQKAAEEQRLLSSDKFLWQWRY